MSVNKYRIFCVTEASWVESYSTSPPTICANNTAHTVNPNSISLLDVIEPNTVFVETDRISTGGHYMARGFMKEIPAGVTGSISIHNETYPYPVNLMLVTMCSDDNASGDRVYMDVVPDTIIGINTTHALGTTTVLHVNDTAISNIKLGFHVNLFTGTTSYDCGKCVSIDTNGFNITTENSVSETVAAGSYVRMTIRNVDYYLSDSLKKTFGAGKIGSTYIPANTTMRLTYINNNGQGKRFWVDNEYTY